MKKIFLLFVLLCTLKYMQAQLTITPGSQLVLTGNAQLTLSNIDLINNGNFMADSGTVSITGNASSAIAGIQNCRFYILEINKTNPAYLALQQAITVGKQINFISGNVDLQGFNIDLGTTGLLNGEQELSHITGLKGGQVVFTANLNRTSSANPGNLGIIITSSQMLGTTVIKRGHQSQISAYGKNASVLRYYDIVPANNSNLNATLRFNYLDAELSGLSESNLALLENQVRANWLSLGSSAHNTASNYVEKNAIASFGRFTLAPAGVTLPQSLISFTANCNGNTMQLAWKTATEQSGYYYRVEKSTDAVIWNTAGNVSATVNAAAENHYSFVDNNTATGNYYRIVEYDSAGNSSISNTAQADCAGQGILRIWPNPASDVLNVSIPSHTFSNATIKLYDTKGALVKQQTVSPANGNNLIHLDVKEISGGLYYITIINSNGQLQTQKLIKE